MNKSFWKSGEPFVWLTAAILLLVLILLVGLISVVVYNSVGVFWQKEIVQVELKNGKKYLGEKVKQEEFEKNNKVEKRIQFKRGNRDIDNMDYVWLDENEIASSLKPASAVCVERTENGSFIGFIKGFIVNDDGSVDQSIKYEELKDQIANKDKLYKEKKNEVYLNNQVISQQIDILKKIAYKVKQSGVVAGDKKISDIIPEITTIHYLLEKNIDINCFATDMSSHVIIRKIIELNKEFLMLKNELKVLEDDSKKIKIVLQDINGVEKTIAATSIVRLIYPNQITVIEKVYLYCSKVVELFFANPRESNTEGGLFPAIVGTVLMVFLMSFLSFPLGVVSGIYLREYAKEGLFIRIVRIAVNNLAGIPSIVYGIFGLGFFVYVIGGSVDSFFYPEKVSEPTFGTGGILWASLTLGILTVPVVIVSTEEALGSISREIRQGSLALGATQFQTLIGVMLPMASPGILTGFILAMSRAAGEVAPLMITGVVKHAPALPIDGEFPFVHLERKFMHLGFQIYDVGFQSPNVEASTPMVYITTLLLLVVIFTLSFGAIVLRNKMKKRYTVKSF